MTVIRKLPPELVDRIAAGEVVERPASVVKELVENALDAGAANVTVEIRGGGIELVSVRDDGCGIGPADLPLAFASHATSKLSALDDLDEIASFGFRGEALASVGAVADCRILSRERGAAAGYEIECRGGALSPVRPAASPEGTLVEVRQLFRHVPARRKFLRSPAAESAQVSAVVEKAALANPTVAFALVRDGRPIFRVAADEGRAARIGRFFGDDLGAALLRAERRDGPLAVEGFVARPEAARQSASFQHLFLNGRPIRDRTLAWALRNAYEGLLTKGMQPVAFLFVTLPAADADVNVHPAKLEVRFRDPERVRRLVQGAVRDALLAADLAPRVPLAAPHPAASGSAPSPQAAAYLDSVKDALADFLSGPVAQGGFVREEPEWRRASATAPAVPAPAPAPAAPAFAQVAPVVPQPPARPVGRYLQARDTYLVFETGDGLAIVDQHALHERIRLEEIHARLDRGGLEVQHLLTPHVVELPASDAEMLLAEAETLAPLGIEIAAFGPSTVAVHALPAMLGGRDPAPLLRDVVERLREGRGPGGHDALVEAVLHSMACRSAVMAGDRLTEAQAAELMRRADLIDTSAGCAHGRPTALRIAFRDIERQFQR